MITLEQLKNAVADIKESEEEWVCDIQTNEYQCMCEGLDMLVRHFQKISDAEKIERAKL
jgi:hypothetical protein